MKRLQKEIHVDGAIHILYSFDGVSWSSDAQDIGNRAGAAALAIQNFHGGKNAKKRWEKKTQLKVDAVINRGVEQAPGLLPVARVESPILGKAKGKNQKYRRNLRRKKDVLVKKVPSIQVKRRGEVYVTPVPVHYHRCHNKRFACQCDQPYFKRKCGGGTVCLRERANV